MKANILVLTGNYREFEYYRNMSSKVQGQVIPMSHIFKNGETLAGGGSNSEIRLYGSWEERPYKEIVYLLHRIRMCMMDGAKLFEIAEDFSLTKIEKL